ncbi:hypothetical protein ACS0TY_007569 [Phlomoides rotata]
MLHYVGGSCPPLRPDHFSGLWSSGLFAESDSDILIQDINGDRDGDVYVMMIVQQIRKIASEMNLLSFEAINRSTNMLSHNLTHISCLSSSEQVLIEEIPPSCIASQREDVRLLPFAVE